MQQYERFIEFLRHVKGDFSVNQRDVFRPAFLVLLNYRFGGWRRKLPRPLRLALAPLYWVPFWFARAFFGIELPCTASVGRKLKLGGSGVFIHRRAQIGSDCTISQNVTIGAKTVATYKQFPVIGDRVVIGAGAVLIGRIQIGDDAAIGPNAVVMTNIPAKARVVMPPPRVLLMQRSPAQVESDAQDMSALQGRF
jgi:serine O-acetyltransferase